MLAYSLTGSLSLIRQIEPDVRRQLEPNGSKAYGAGAQVYLQHGPLGPGTPPTPGVSFACSRAASEKNRKTNDPVMVVC